MDVSSSRTRANRPSSTQQNTAEQNRTDYSSTVLHSRRTWVSLVNGLGGEKEGGRHDGWFRKKEKEGEQLPGIKIMGFLKAFAVRTLSDIRTQDISYFRISIQRLVNE
jgi:hypothetical protein